MSHFGTNLDLIEDPFFEHIYILFAFTWQTRKQLYNVSLELDLKLIPISLVYIFIQHE